jgi:hypothetical protein
MKHFLHVLTIFFFFTPLSFSQWVIIDDFENGVGHFPNQTTSAGQHGGILSHIPEVDPTTAYQGQNSLKVLFIDDPNSTVNPFTRLWSGQASPANNTPMQATGYFGFWMKVNRPYLRLAITVDESAPSAAATEFSDTVNVNGDGNWHLYQWSFEDSTRWYAWVGASNGVISSTVTLDAIWFFAPNDLMHNDTVRINIDYVAWNPNGQLPVELVSFSAVSENNVVDLRWITSTETNNMGFEVERKSGNNEFEKIGFVNGKGTTTQLNSYVYSDVVNAAGNYTYRLKQVDFDGTFEYSNLVEVDVIIVPGEYSLTQNYPNPFNPSTSIIYNIAEAGLVNLSVYNMLGEKVAELVNEIQDAGVKTVNFNASNLASGTYIYKLNINGNSIAKKMTLMK